MEMSITEVMLVGFLQVQENTAGKMVTNLRDRFGRV